MDGHVISSVAMALSLIHHHRRSHTTSLKPCLYIYPDYIFLANARAPQLSTGDAYYVRAVCTSYSIYIHASSAFVCVIISTLYTQLPHAHAKNMLRRCLHTLSSAVVAAAVIVSYKYSAVVAAVEKREQLMAAAKIYVTKPPPPHFPHARTRSGYISARRLGRIKEI